MRVRNEECFVLRTIPILESSLIVDVFTRNHGRHSLMAKGARRLKSRYRGSVRPFQLLQVSWSGKNEVPTMTSLVQIAGPTEISGRQVYCSYYLNELIIRFVRQSIPYPKLFSLYQDSLGHLADLDSEFITLRKFEKNMLKLLGYELVLNTEADSLTPIRHDKLYHYDFESGPIPAAHPTENSISGGALMAVSEEKFESPVDRQECQLFLRRAIEYFCEGKTNRSREVFRQTIRTRC